MPEPTIKGQIATDLAEAGVKDEWLVHELLARIPEQQTGDLDGTAAAELAMSVLSAACSLPQPSAEELATYPPSGEIKRLRTTLAEARQDPHSLESATALDLVRALLVPRARRA